MWLSLLRVVATIRSFLLNIFILHSTSIVVFQFLCLIQLFVTPWATASQAPLSSSVSWSLFQFMSIESVVVSNHHILCCPRLLLPSIFTSIRVFSNELALHMTWPKYWHSSISPSSEYSGMFFFRMDWFDLHAFQVTLKSLLQHHSSKAWILWCSAFFMAQFSHLYMTTRKP